MTAGSGVTVEGSGSPSSPYVISSDAAAIPTPVQAGDTPTVDTTVSGSGTAGAPYVVSAAVVLEPAPPGGGSNSLHSGPDGVYVECADVRGCISGGDGIDFNPAIGEIAARPSTDAGNAAVFGTDGGIYAPADGSAVVTTACGLADDGSATDPLAAVVGTWAYPCGLDANAGQVYCDSNGQLRSEPRPAATFQVQSLNQNYPATAVPVPTDTVVEQRPFSVTNPDPCRSAYVIFEAELDIDFTLPPGAAAEYGIGGDDMTYMKNSGTTTQALVHVQTTKIYQRTIPPGDTLIEPFDVTMGDATGSPTYSRIQTAHRAFLFNL